jgi:PPOX class probable F420-dependent enzyme
MDGVSPSLRLTRRFLVVRLWHGGAGWSGLGGIVARRGWSKVDGRILLVIRSELVARRVEMTTEPSKTYPELKVMAEQFLKDHRLGVLATGRKSGMPQQSIVGYQFDGADVVISTGDNAAKVKNIRRRPLVSIAVTDGPTCVVVSGEARLLQGAEAESYLGEAPGSGRQTGTPTLIVFAAASYRWARLEG